MIDYVYVNGILSKTHLNEKWKSKQLEMQSINLDRKVDKMLKLRIIILHAFTNLPTSNNYLQFPTKIA